MPFLSFKQSMRAGFLQTRKLFFAVVVVFHAIITLVAAVDVSSDNTRHSDVHLTTAVLNLAINLFSFITITLLALLDSIDQQSRWYVSQVRFEVTVVLFITCLQLVNGIAYAASLPRFGCTYLDSTCATVGRLVLVGCWIVTTLYMFYAAYFTAIAVLAGQRVKKVWVTPTKLFAWDPVSLPISRPSAPIDILGDGATMIQVRQRETWADPQHDRGTSSPKLPPLPALPVPPLPPLPTTTGVDDPYPGQTYPGQKLRRGASPAIFATDPKAESDSLQDVSSLDLVTKSRPLTVVSESENSRYSPPTEPLTLKGHSKGAFSHDSGAARYARITRQTSIKDRGDWMTPGFTYGREYVERTLSRQPSLPSSPRAGLPANRRQPSINSYRLNPDGRYPNFF